MFGKVAVLMGGTSAEREISLVTGEAILKSLIHQGIDAHAIDTKDKFIHKLTDENFSRVFLALHGRGGEDGTIQGLLETIGLPYTGSGVLGSALTLDKDKTKRFLQSAGYPTPPWAIYTKESNPEEIVQLFGLPLVVKPTLEGSSNGVFIVNSIDELTKAFEKSSKFGTVMVEQYIEGDEFVVGILGNRALPSIQVIPSADFYDYEAKYNSNKTKYLCPSPLGAKEEKYVQNLVLNSFLATGCSGWGRTETIRDLNGDFWILDINTIPGLTPKSLLPKAAKVIGIGFDELVLEILSGTLTPKENKNIKTKDAKA